MIPVARSGRDGFLHRGAGSIHRVTRPLCPVRTPSTGRLHHSGGRGGKSARAMRAFSCRAVRGNPRRARLGRETARGRVQRRGPRTADLRRRPRRRRPGGPADAREGRGARTERLPAGEPAAAPSSLPGAAAGPARDQHRGRGARALSPDRTPGTRCVVSCSAAATGEAARERSLQLIVPAEDAAAASACTRPVRGRSKGCSRSSTAGGKPPWRSPTRRERPASGMSEVSPRALEIACTGRRNIHVAGSDSHPRYGAFAHALLPDLNVEAPRETTRILSHLRPRGHMRPRGPL